MRSQTKINLLKQQTKFFECINKLTLISPNMILLACNGKRVRFCLPILIGFAGVDSTNYFVDLRCLSQHRFITYCML